MKQIEAFKIIGISVRTTNENNQQTKDIPALWNRLMTTGVLANIPNKVSDEIYSIYTEYESDHTKPYTTILGCRVSSLENIPDGMIGKSFEGGKYTEFVAKGDLTKGAVYDAWLQIWNEDINRSYTADFEVYGENAQNPTDAEVTIFVAVN